MKEVWFKGTKDREKVKRDFAVTRPIFEILEGLLKEKIKSPKDLADYTLAGWPFYRADCDGYNRALTEVLELIRED